MLKRFWMLLTLGWSCLAMAAVEQQFTKDLAAETFTQVSTLEMIHDVRLTQRTLTFSLHDPIWHYTYNGSPIDFVGSQVTIKSVSLPDLVTNTENLKHVGSVKIFDEDGNEVSSSTAKEALAALVRLPTQNGTYVEARVYKYTFGEGVQLDTNKSYKLYLETTAATPPLLPVFRNASSEYTDADRSFVRIDGGDPLYSPYMSFNGQMTMTRFSYDVTQGETSLAKLLGDDSFNVATNDNVDTMIVVRLTEQNAILKMDHSLSNAALVVASSTPATTWEKTGEVWTPLQRAGTVRFIDGYTFTGPVDFRDVKGAEGEIKMIRLEYTGEGAPVIPRGIWAPTTFALHCDLELSAYPDMLIDSEAQPSWFGRNPLTIPAGRSIRIVTHVNESNIPQIAYGDATSRLALAIPSSEPHVLSHYRNLIEQNSGILRMVSPFLIPVKEGTTSLVLGVDNDEEVVTPPSVQTLQSYDATTFVGSLVVGYGVNNNAQYVQKSGTVTVGGEGLILGQGDAATAKYVVKDGTFTGKVTFGPLAHDAALMVGDGVGEANTAIANVSTLLSQPAGSTATITGTAEVIVERDGQLVLEGDLDMTPALRRRMTLNGGTLKAMGATPTYTFGTDFVNGGGLTVNGDVTIDASEATPRFQKSAVDADMTMEFEGNNIIVTKNAETAWFTAWSETVPTAYNDSPTGQGFQVSDSVKPTATGCALQEFGDYSVAIGVNMEEVTAENAVLFSIGTEQNAWALRRKNATTIEVIRFTSNWEVNVEASYTSETLSSGWHLLVLSVDNDVSTEKKSENEFISAITATKVTLFVDNEPIHGSNNWPFRFKEKDQTLQQYFKIGAPIKDSYGVVATGLLVDNCYTWNRALTAGEVRALRPTLSIDAITGGSANGSLTIDGTVSIGSLGNFKGLIQATQPSNNNDGGNIRINHLSGVTSDITIGYLGRRDTSVVADILALTHQDGVVSYRGTLGFSAEVYPLVDVSQTEERDLYAQLRIENGQTLRIRLDQFADATILWPETIDENNPPKLVLIESGAYGGLLTIPHLPELVAQNTSFEHYTYGANTTPHTSGFWMIEADENGATDTFTWEYPNFTGNSAWIDAEFNGNSDNTGWMRLGTKNGLLVGYEINEWGVNDYGRLMNANHYFAGTYNPEGLGVKMRYHPYVAPEDLTYPNAWSAAIRLIAPNQPRTTILAIGGAAQVHDYDNNWNVIATHDAADALVLATGETANDLVLWHIAENSWNDDNGDGVPNGMYVVAEAKVADITNIPHVFSAVCDGKKLSVYLDGGLLTEYTLPKTWRGFVRGGLQVGQLLDEGWHTDYIKNLCKGSPTNTDEGCGVVDYIRFYKGVLTDQAMEVLAEEAPAVYRNARYVREVTSDGFWEDETEKPWFKETWDANQKKWVRAADGEARPAEGAEIQIYVNGKHTLQVNTMRLATQGFLSANRTYTMLNVYPMSNVTANSELVLQPLGGEIDPVNLEASEWHTSLTNGAFTYGYLKFTGGCGTPIHEDEACADYDNPSGALGIHGSRQVDANAQIKETMLEEIYSDAIVSGECGKWIKTRTVTQTKQLQRTVTGGEYTAHLTASAGVVKFARSADILLGAVYAESYTEQQIWTRTIAQVKTSGSWDWPAPPDEDASWTQWTNVSGEIWSRGEWIATDDDTRTELTPAAFELRADYSLIRNLQDEESKLLHLTGPVMGHGTLIANSAIEQPNANGQVSNCVWIPAFNEELNWLLNDVTETAYGAGSNPGGSVNGLLVQVRQIPGRLYLDLADAEFVDGSTFFSIENMPWYRYGYKGDNTVSPAPVKASEKDLDTAIAFQIRVPSGTVKKLHANGNIPPASSRIIATLRVESDNANGDVPTLKLLTTPGNGTLFVNKQLITSVRFEDIGETPAGALTDASTLVTSERALIHGHTTGTYAFKNRTFSRAMVHDSIATLEAHGDNNHLLNNFELRNTHLVLAEGATLAQEGETNHLWAKSLTMGNGAIFRFDAAGEDAESNGVVFTENVKMTGATATLHGYGQADGVDNTHRCNFTAAGIEGPTDKAAVLTLNSAGNERWICYTANLVDHTETGGSLGLTKVGSGIMAFRSPTPPTVTGPVRVEQGILRVGTEPFSDDALNADQHLTAAIGHSGLYVAAGASLEPNHYANAKDIIACIKGGQTLSGTGTIGGVLRLNRGAQLENCLGMTVRKIVVDGSMVADVNVALPEDVESGDVLFHIMDESARAEVRRRLSAKKGAQRWDVGVNHNAGDKDCQSHYVVYEPGVPVPQNPSTSEGNVYDATIESIFIRYYQGYNVAHLQKADGRTMVQVDPETSIASYYALNAAEIGNAFRCFSNIWTFAPVADSEDESDLLMAYEFGISDLTIRELTDTSAEGKSPYVIVKVKVENKLASVFGDTILGSNNTADFQLNTEIEFAVDENTILTGRELASFDETALPTEAPASHTAGVRYYAIPFTEENFPMGTTDLTARIRRTDLN